MVLKNGSQIKKKPKIFSKRKANDGGESGIITRLFILYSTFNYNYFILIYFLFFFSFSFECYQGRRMICTSPCCFLSLSCAGYTIFSFLILDFMDISFIYRYVREVAARGGNQS